MRCDIWHPLIMEAAENGLEALASPERDRLNSHLAQCGDCRAALADQRMVREALHRRVDAPVPAGFAARVRAAVSTERALDPERSWVELLRWQAWTYRLAPLAAGLLLFGVVTARSVPADDTLTLSDLAEAWVFDDGGPEGRPAFTVWGESDVDGEMLLDAILSAEPDEPLTEGDPS